MLKKAKIRHGELSGTDCDQCFNRARFRHLMEIARTNRPTDELDIISPCLRAFPEHHSGQQRASGEPYLVHPLEVAILLAEMKLDTTAIAAGLLHDSVEDTSVTTEEIREQFGEQVAHIVEGVTKISKIDSLRAKRRRRKTCAR